MKFEYVVIIDKVMCKFSGGELDLYPISGRFVDDPTSTVSIPFQTPLSSDTALRHWHAMTCYEYQIKTYKNEYNE